MSRRCGRMCFPFEHGMYSSSQHLLRSLRSFLSFVTTLRTSTRRDTLLLYTSRQRCAVFKYYWSAKREFSPFVLRFYL